MSVKRPVLILLFACCAISSLCAKSKLSFSGNEASLVGIYIEDLGTGNVIVAENDTKVMTPASVTKSVTTAVAQLVLPQNFRFKTNVYLLGDSEVRNGCLTSDIIIKTSGDPTLESEYFPEKNGFVDSIVSSILRRGIKKIRGQIIIDTSNVEPIGTNPTWMLEDVAWDYGTGHQALNYRDNKFLLKINNFNEVQVALQDSGFIDIENNMTEGEVNEVEMLRSGDSKLVLKGSSSGPQKLSCSMPYPDKVLVYELESKLHENGITIDKSVGVNCKDTIMLYEHESPLRDDILRSLMVRSDNLYADAMLCAIAPGGEKVDSVYAVLNNLEIDCRYISLYDGCGLSRVNRLSPRFLAKLYKKMAGLKDYIATFPKSGIDGTLRYFLNDTRLEGRLALKTGSMGGVQCYGGYKLNEKGEPSHVVVVMVNNFFCEPKEVRNAIKRLFLQIF